MMYKTTLLLCFLWTTTYSQKSVSLGLRTGFMFYDLINQKEDIDDFINGYGTQLDIFANYQHQLRKLHVLYGFGFTRLDYLDNNLYFTRVPNTKRSIFISNYINTSIGLRIPLKSQKVKFGADLMLYILAHKEKISFAERRMFANIDLSLSFKFKKVELILSTPITVSPIYRENSSAYLSQAGEFVLLNSFVEMTG